MLKVRLSRLGGKKNPFYHIVVCDSEYRRDGRFLEQIGTYDPSRAADSGIDEARLQHWVTLGATPTTRVAHVVRELRRAGAPGTVVAKAKAS